MRKIIASCAAIALFAQFTADAKVAGKPAQDKEKKVENVDVNECECEKDLFAGGYISFGFGYGSTKDKLESDLTVVGTTEALDAAADTEAAINASLNHSQYLYDSVKAEATATEHVKKITATKNSKSNKKHHDFAGSFGAGYMHKMGANAYVGFEGNVSLAGDSTTEIALLDMSKITDENGVVGPSAEQYKAALKRKGISVGANILLGYKFGQNWLVYGKVGARSSQAEIVPVVANRRTKRSIAPEFGIGVKRASRNGKAALGLEASYVLNKKINMSDAGKGYMQTGIFGTQETKYAIEDLEAQDSKDTTVAHEDATAKVRAKRSGTWKVALTVTMPIA